MNIKDYFSFTRGEKRGTVVLLLIIVVLIAANFSVDLLKSTQQTDFSEFETAINEFEKEREQNSKSGNSQKETLTIELFDFNPNTISDKEWKNLGFKDWQIKTINNYKAKGGNWKTKADVAKIYGLKETHFQQLEPFILLPDSYQKKEKYYSKNPSSQKAKDYTKKVNINTADAKELINLKGINSEKYAAIIIKHRDKLGGFSSKEQLKEVWNMTNETYNGFIKQVILGSFKLYQVDINTADAEELTNLKGINSEKYAAIIIKYRKELGGFTKKEQLLEVWNMTEETYNGFINQVIIGDFKPYQININTSTAKELKAHPYVDWKTANAIFKYRKANGNYKKVEDIKKIHLINNETYLKISPYLTIN